MSDPAARAAAAADARVEAAAARTLDKALRQAARDAARDVDAALAGVGPGAEVRRDQAAAALAAVLARLAAVLPLLDATVRDGRAAAAVAAERTARGPDRAVMRRALRDPRVRAYLASPPRAAMDAVELVERRLQGAGWRPLSEKVYRTGLVARGQVDTAVRSALARGLSAREFQREVVALVDPSTPGGASYAARRLAVTELNNAFHARSVVGAQERPWVAGMRWTLSNTHPKPDRCDEYAAYDDGHGQGVFPVDLVPGKPHPHDRCTITAVDAYDYDRHAGAVPGAPSAGAEDAWLDAFEAGDYDVYIDRQVAAARAR